MLRHFVALAACLPLAALASEHAGPAQADAVVPPVVYQSVFAHYQAMQDEGQTPDKIWAEANREVGRIGGHAGYLREAPGPDAASKTGGQGSPAPQPSAAPSAPHHQH